MKEQYILYRITNTINNMIYIGQTINTLERRWSGHKWNAKNTNTPLYSAMKKYGIENFEIEEIGGANSQDELNYQEWLLIHKHSTLYPNGYNMIEGGGSTGKRSTETLKKMSKEGKSRWCKEKPNPISKPVINIETGDIWISAKECWKENSLKICYSNFKSKLNGTCGNETPFRYIGEEDNVKKIGNNKPKMVIDTITGKVYKTITKCWKENLDTIKIKRETFSWHLKNKNRYKNFTLYSKD